MPGLFQSVAVFALVAGGIMLVFAKPLRKWMGGFSKSLPPHLSVARHYPFFSD